MRWPGGPEEPKRNGEISEKLRTWGECEKKVVAFQVQKGLAVLRLEVLAVAELVLCRGD